MTILAVAVIAALVLLLIVERTESRRQLQQVIDAYDLARSQERAQWDRERQTLLNRIKPETAQSVIDPNITHVPAAVGFDADDEYWESKEQFAARLMREELEARSG